MFCTLTFTSALSLVTVQCPIWLFSVVSWFSTFHVHLFTVSFWDSPSFPYHYRYQYCLEIPHPWFLNCTVFVSWNFSTPVLITLLSPDIATSVITHVPFSLPRIMLSGLLLGMVLSVRTFWFHYMVTLCSGFVSTNLLHGRTGVRCLLLLLFLFARDTADIFSCEVWRM